MASATARIRRRFQLGMATVITGAALLGGCADGVEVNSPLLNSLGVATGALGQKPEPKLAPRAPLVMPPSTQRLPQPGETPTAAAGPAADPSWPKDKDQERVASATQKQRAQKQYCRDGNWKERSMDNDLAGMQGPSGSCNTFLDWVGNMFNGPEYEKDQKP